jgi:hypothetical protein
MQAMLRQLREAGQDADKCWSNIVDVCVKTVLSVQPQLAASYRKFIPRSSTLGTPKCTCFDVLGKSVVVKCV